MRKWTISISLLAAAGILTALALLPAGSASASGTVGAQAPAFRLPDLSGQEHSLVDYRGKVVVLEWINPNCPFSDRHAREHTMTNLHHEYGDVAWLAINSTSPDSRDFLTPDEHAAWARERGIDYTILYDRRGEVGHAYGARTTPHMFIIDPDGVILYNGAIDDDPPGRKSPTERMNYVDAGLGAATLGGLPEPATTKPYGCSVKY